MLTIDFSPLYRSMIGFDRFAEALELAERAAGDSDGYPPYDIEKTGENSYRITLALAGFREDELSIEVRDQTLFVAGQRQAEVEGEAASYLHHGIARRAFERRFELADHVEVTGARLENGLLSIELARELPEALKPRSIPIQSGATTVRGKSAKQIEGKAHQMA